MQEEGWTYLHMSACLLILHEVADYVAHVYKQHTAHIVIFYYSYSDINTVTIMLGCLQFVGKREMCHSGTDFNLGWGSCIVIFITLLFIVSNIFT